MSLTFGLESPLTDEARALLKGSDAALRAVYSEDECFTLDPEELDIPAVFFIVARLDGVAVGCVAMLKCGDYVEVKRLFVSPDGRGHGIGRALMENFHLRAEAIDITTVRLETGDKLPEAVKLYRSLGYVEIGPFGEYEDVPASLFMEKTL